MNPDNANEDGLTYGEWLARVDEHLLRICGFTHRDLPDTNTYDLWNDSVPPREAAEEILAEDELFQALFD